MFTSNTSLTSEYCKQAQCQGLPKLRWSTAVAEFWSGEWNLKVQDMKRDENQSDNLRHLKTVCLDGLPLFCVAVEDYPHKVVAPKTRQITFSQKQIFFFQQVCLFKSLYRIGKVSFSTTIIELGYTFYFTNEEFREFTFKMVRSLQI